MDDCHSDAIRAQRQRALAECPGDLDLRQIVARDYQRAGHPRKAIEIMADTSCSPLVLKLDPWSNDWIHQPLLPTASHAQETQPVLVTTIDPASNYRHNSIDEEYQQRTLRWQDKIFHLSRPARMFHEVLLFSYLVQTMRVEEVERDQQELQLWQPLISEVLEEAPLPDRRSLRWNLFKCIDNRQRFNQLAQYMYNVLQTYTYPTLEALE